MARALTHNEYLLRGPRVLTHTWVHRSEAGPVAALRAYFLPGTRLGAVFPMSGAGPELPPEALASLLSTALEWLRPLGPLRCLAAVPNPTGGSGSVLEGAGFARVVSSKLMVRPTSG